MSNFGNAQNSPDITGSYNLGSSSPEGGSHLIVLEKGDYAITYFGGIQTGKWQFEEDKTVKFTPNLKKSKFELFGRHNKELSGNTKIFFSGFENSETFIQLRTTGKEEITLQRVFNTDANCFSFPYIYSFSTVAVSISFMSIQYGDDNNSVITIENPEKYNDFVAYFIEVDNITAETFFATFKDNKLYFEEDKIAHRTSLDKDDEDIEFLKNIINMEANRDTIYFNPSYNMFGQPDSNEGKQDIHENHVYDKQKNAFIDTEYYIEGEENTLSDDSYENMSIIYAYSALKKHIQKSTNYNINEKPLFQVSCD